MFSEQLKKARSTSKMSQKELASKLFISQQAYAKYETGTATPNPDMLKLIAVELGTTVDYLLGSVPRHEKGIKIPILGAVQAGYPVYADEEVLDYEEIDTAMAASGEYFALYIRGNSMEPKFSEGDVVIIRKQSTVDNGEIGVFLVNGDDATIKKFSQSKDGIMLIATNPSYDPLFYSNTEIEELPVLCLGKVVELRAKF